MASAATLAMRFLSGLEIPEGPLAGRKLKLAPFQREFVKGAFAPKVNVGCLSVGRGNGKTMLSAGLALAELLGITDSQPRREILIAARSRDQGRVAWLFIEGLCRMLPDATRARLQFRRAPILSISLDNEHEIRVLAADGKTALGTSPTLVLLDERGHWALDRGDALEHALLTGLGKRGGRALIISTSAPSDAHPFSRWLDEPQLGVYAQEHRPPPSLPADDRDSLLVANPGAALGIGASIEWIEAQARQAIGRGGTALSSFRLYHRNERVEASHRDLLLTVDQWLACEVAQLPPRSGPCVIGLDAGGSSSMSAAAFYWPETGRLEVKSCFPGIPTLAERGAADTVGNRYVDMRERGELATLGDRTVPSAAWLAIVMGYAGGAEVAAILADRYKQAEIGEAIDKAGIRAPIIWRGMGFRDGGEDCERFQRAAFDGKVLSRPSLLLRSAFADAVIVRDDANNMKLTKLRSNGRIDAASAAVLAVAEGARMTARGSRPSGRLLWA
jgi:phage terminase large subunit-like protein